MGWVVAWPSGASIVESENTNNIITDQGASHAHAPTQQQIPPPPQEHQHRHTSTCNTVTTGNRRRTSPFTKCSITVEMIMTTSGSRSLANATDARASKKSPAHTHTHTHKHMLQIYTHSIIIFILTCQRRPDERSPSSLARARSLSPSLSPWPLKKGSRLADIHTSKNRQFVAIHGVHRRKSSTGVGLINHIIVQQ